MKFREVKCLYDIKPVIDIPTRSRSESCILSPAKSNTDVRNGALEKVKSVLRNISLKKVRTIVSKGRHIGYTDTGSLDTLAHYNGCCTNIKLEKYELLHRIGGGAYGKIVLVKNNIDGKFYACKILSKSRIHRTVWWKSPDISRSHMDGMQEISGEECDVMEREEAVLLKLRDTHANINKVVDIIRTDDMLISFFIFELCEYGSILELSPEKDPVMYSEELVKVYSLDITNGLMFLHSMYILHGDIKPENVLLKSSSQVRDSYGIDRTRTGIAQIADFGNSRIFSSSSFNLPMKMLSWKFSPAFTPPELCQSELGLNRAPPIDIWALGVTMYCLGHGELPWKGETPDELFRSISEVRPKISSRFTRGFSEVLMEILDKDPESRPSIDTIRSHPWFEYRRI